MSEKIIALDIQKGEGTVLDIARVFPMTTPRALDLARHGKFIDGMIAVQSSNDIDLSIDAIIRIKRFSTLDMLDIALPEIVDPGCEAASYRYRSTALCAIRSSRCQTREYDHGQYYIS